MKLTKREQQIRTFLLEEHQRAIEEEVAQSGRYDRDSWFADGQLNEASAILGKVLDILGG